MNSDNNTYSLVYFLFTSSVDCIIRVNKDLTDKPNRNRNQSGKESKGDINIYAVVIGHFCYGDWGSKWNSIV